MAKKTAPLLPATEDRLGHFGDRLRLARLRRNLTSKQVAERAGMTPVTLRALERGGSGVTIGAYLAVMQTLGIDQDLDLVAREDVQGRDLQDARLQQGRRTKSVSPAPSAHLVKPTPAPSQSPPPDAEGSQSLPDNEWAVEDNFVSSEALASLIVKPKTGKRGRG
jgi:transcriptional regulator with XRE-family HTH domain